MLLYQSSYFFVLTLVFFLLAQKYHDSFVVFGIPLLALMFVQSQTHSCNLKSY